MHRKTILLTFCSAVALVAPSMVIAQTQPAQAPIPEDTVAPAGPATAADKANGSNAAGTGIAAAAQATAAADQGQLADIVVTAQRREESLQRVPVAVTAIGRETLDSRGITSLANLSTSVSSGLVVEPFAGSVTTLSFNIRGATGSDPGTGLTEQGVAVYVDGVPIGRATGAGVELGDIERIEILRGPQGTLFGRNAEGGAVQYVTARPSGQFHARIEGQYGNYGAERVVGQVEFPLTDTLAVKVGGLLDRHDGYVKNGAIGPADTVNPKDVNDFGYYNNKGFRIAARWRPISGFEAYYSFDFTNTRSTNYFTTRTGSRTPSEPAFCSIPTFAGFCASPTTLAANIFTGTQQPQDPGIKQAPYPLYDPENVDKVRGHTLIMSYQASDQITLKSITGYRTLSEGQINNLGAALPFVQFVPSTLFDGNAANGEVPAGTQVGVSGSISTVRIRQDQVSQEVQFLGKFDRLDITAGGFYFHEKVQDTRDSFFDLAYVAFGGGQTGVVSVDPFALSPSRVGYRASADSYAAYAQGTWTPPVLDDKLKLTLGLRYTNDTKRFLRSISDFNPAQLGVRSRFKNGRFDPAVILGYQASDAVNFYAKYSSAYRAGGTQIRNKIALTTYDPEVNKTFEVGAKTSLFDRHMRFNMAAFRSRITGKQFTIQNVNTDPSSTNTLNLGVPITIKGVETELTVAPVRGIVLGANYAYLDVNQPSSSNGAPFALSGAPKHSLSLTGDFSTRVMDEAELALHVDYNYLSSYVSSSGYFPPINTEPTKLSSTNARLDLRNIAIGGMKADIYVYGRNLFNVHDYTYTFATGTSDFTLSTVGGAANVVAPRTYGVGLRLEL